MVTTQSPTNSTLNCTGTGCLGPLGWQHMSMMDIGHLANPDLCVAVEESRYLGFVVPDITFMCLACIETLT